MKLDYRSFVSDRFYVPYPAREGHMTDNRNQQAREADWERSERKSFWIALAIALVPIPASLLISWALGSPPWRTRPLNAPRSGRRGPGRSRTDRFLDRPRTLNASGRPGSSRIGRNCSGSDGGTADKFGVGGISGPARDGRAKGPHPVASREGTRLRGPRGHGLARTGKSKRRSPRPCPVPESSGRPSRTRGKGQRDRPPRPCEGPRSARVESPVGAA